MKDDISMKSHAYLLGYYDAMENGESSNPFDVKQETIAFHDYKNGFSGGMIRFISMSEPPMSEEEIIEELNNKDVSIVIEYNSKKDVDGTIKAVWANVPVNVSVFNPDVSPHLPPGLIYSNKVNSIITDNPWEIYWE